MDEAHADLAGAKPNLTLKADFLLWWTRNGPTPGPLVTTGSLLDKAPGALGSPHTAVLYGDNGLDYRLQAGGRWTLDWWFDNDRSFGLEPTGFLLETHTFHFPKDSDKTGSPLIARPFFNVLTGQPDAQIVTAPGFALGGIDVFTDSRLWNAEINLLAKAFISANLSGEVLAGVRHIGQDESLRISQSSTLLSGSTGFFGSSVLPPDILSLTDRIDTRNEYWGGQVGGRVAWQWHGLKADVSGKIGIGSNHQSVRLTGRTQRTTSDGITLSGPGGLLEVASNYGLRSRDEFTYASEVGLNFEYAVTSHVSLGMGYTFFYWDDVARPGTQVTPAINPSYVPFNSAYGKQPTPPLPSPIISGSSFWAQGLHFSIAVNF